MPPQTRASPTVARLIRMARMAIPRCCAVDGKRDFFAIGPVGGPAPCEAGAPGAAHLDRPGATGSRVRRAITLPCNRAKPAGAVSSPPPGGREKRDPPPQGGVGE